MISQLFSYFLSFGLIVRLAGLSCSWSKTGDFDEPGVHVISLSCANGFVEWNAFNGAIMINIKRFDKSIHYDQVICIQSNQRFNGGVIYRFANKKPELIVKSKNDIANQFCMFLSKKEEIIQILIESDPTIPKHEVNVGFFYSIIPFGKFRSILNSYSDPVFLDNELLNFKSDLKKTCGPCSTEEVLEAFCKSDLIARAKPIKNELKLNKNKNIHFNVDKLYRRPDYDQQVLYRPNEHPKSNKFYAIIEDPHNCVDNERNQEELLIIAKVELGRARFKCSIKWSNWFIIQTLHKNKSKCDLTTN